LAWKEYANACRYLGRFDTALDAINRAERAYRRLLSNEIELAIMDYVRGTVLWKKERFEEALACARKSSEAFSAFRDRDRWVNARLLEGAILGDMHAYEAARDIFTQLHEAAEAGGDLLVLARVLHGLGNICTDTGDVGHASVHPMNALQLYTSLGISTEITRARWSLAVLTLVSGNAADACLRLAVARDECVALDMLTDAALVTLDLIEANVVLGRRSDIRRLCAEAVECVKGAGMAPAAARGVVHLRECADRGTLTQVDVRQLKTSLRRLEAQPIERAIEIYLRQCYRAQTVARVSELAEHLGANRTYLSRLVHEVLGKPLGTVLRARLPSFGCFFAILVG
jgi:tetratricopeptide (TPR) repeat protein